MRSQDSSKGTRALLVLAICGFVGIPSTLSEGAYEFVTSWGSYGTGDGQFKYAHSISVDSSGNVYVCDWLNHRIQKFTDEGTFIGWWGGCTDASHAGSGHWHEPGSGHLSIKGSGDGQFDGPYDIAVDSSGYVYVTGAYNQRVQKFTGNGTFMTKWGGFQGPRGIIVDSSGYVYVVDHNGHCVYKFESDGTFVTKWGDLGTGDGQFYYPEGVTVDSSGYVFVADSLNQRIEKFTSNGDFVTKWDGTDGGGPPFQLLKDVAVDSLGYVYAVDSHGNLVLKFDGDGTIVTKWGSYGTENGQFDHPSGIAIDTSGCVYVCDTSNHRVQKFSLNVAPVADAGGPYSGITEGVLVDVDPDTLNLNSSGKWVTTYLVEDVQATAEIELDGSDSYDDDDDDLTYKWMIADIEGNIIEVLEETSDEIMIISLPAGEYVAQLIVNDGIEDSEPHYAGITIGLLDVSSLPASDIYLNGIQGDKSDFQVPELMVKFDRTAVADTVDVGIDVPMVISGSTCGVDFITVIDEGNGGKKK